MIKYNEIYPAIEGEGIWQGMLSYFVRFSGCNLECNFCDTNHKECGQKTPQSIADSIIDFFGYEEAKRVVITGGEPFLQQSDLLDLITILINLKKCEICIYTNGTIEIPFPVINHPNIHIILDYKLKEVEKMVEKNLISLGKKDIIKFVIDDVNQLSNIIRITKDYKSNFIITPSYNLINPMVIADKMIKLKVNNIKLGLQQHKYIYPSHMTGV